MIDLKFIAYFLMTVALIFIAMFAMYEAADNRYPSNQHIYHDEEPRDDQL